MVVPTTGSPKRLIIVGGVAGGASCAARARRLSEEIEVIVVEQGEYVSFASCGLPYHISGEIAERSKLLLQTPESLKSRFNIDVRTLSRVEAVDSSKKTVTIRSLPDESVYTERYDYLVLAPGAAPYRPRFDGGDHSRIMTLRNVNNMDTIKASVAVFKPRSVIVVGGSHIGLQMAESLTKVGVLVTLLEMSDHVLKHFDREMASFVRDELRKQGVDLRLNTSISAVTEVASGDLECELTTGDKLLTSFVVMAVGVRPDVQLAKSAGVKLGPCGGIRVDASMRTSIPSIFAVGDAAETPDFVFGREGTASLAGPANRQGRIAADNVLGRHSVYRKTQCTSVCRVFDLTAASLGHSVASLREAHFTRYEYIYVVPPSHATYFPGSSPVHLKLIFDSFDGRILGAQAVGCHGIDKRIDVLAVAQRANMTVFDLEHLELSYAPPFNSAKDPVNLAGFVAANVLRGEELLCHYKDVVEADSGTTVLLDVRNESEVHVCGAVPKSVHIPLDELRRRHTELPRSKEIIVFCQVGHRGHVAHRLLQNLGYRSRNLTGGYKMFQATADAL